MHSSTWSFLLPLLFASCSISLFLHVHDTTKLVIDEEFHLKQGLSFCNKRFDVWDSKITTFPGLYLMSVMLNPLNLCNVLGLRLISFVAATVNVILFYKIRRFNLGGAHSSEAALDAFALAALPPLYFFTHVYYTDVLALTFVLLFYYNWLKDARLYSAIFAAASVLMRQTNIVWICMTVGITALDMLVTNYANMKGIRWSKVRLFNLKTWFEILTSYKVLYKSAWQTFVRSCLALLIIIPFVVFVILNGSIVVGDKRAHEATMHLPQLFYFSLFTLVFGVSNTLQNLMSTIRMLLRDKLIVVFILGVFVLIAKWNTLVHPYLLADNRHYTFYIWNRFYGRYEWFKYAMTPVYIIALTLILSGLKRSRDSFLLMFSVSIILALCFQKLLELRYFIIPFVLFRLHTGSSIRARWTYWIELFSYILLNFITFYIFFTKEIKWRNYTQPQRIIW